MDANDHRKVDVSKYFQFLGFLKEKIIETINKGNIE